MSVELMDRARIGFRNARLSRSCGARVTVLELEGVSKSFQRERNQLDALVDVDLRVDYNEVVSVTGGGRASRSTLTRVAGGLLAPDAGVVRVEGVTLDRRDATAWRQVAVGGTQFLPSHGSVVYEHVMIPLLALGASRIAASVRAHRVLEQVGAVHLAMAEPRELAPGELIRVALARAVVREPAVLIMDEPIVAVGSTEGEAILGLMRDLAHGSALGVLVTADETTPVTGADRNLHLDGGRLLSNPVLAHPEPTAPLRAGVEPST